jgi:Flp pilus assembly protein TadG
MKLRSNSTSALDREHQILPSVNSPSQRLPKAAFPRPGRVGLCSRRGGSFVEFTLVMPILLLVMTGMASFGFALHNELVLTNAVNAGAQTLAFSRGQTTDPCATAYSAISSAGPSLGTGLSLTFVINGATYTATNTCSAGAAEMSQGASAQISASYPCQLGVFGMSFPSCSLKTQVTEFIQ